MPQCNRDGSFVEVQCHGPSNECWCVDKQGRELTGTRRTGPLKCVGLGLFTLFFAPFDDSLKNLGLTCPT